MFFPPLNFRIIDVDDPSENLGRLFYNLESSLQLVNALVSNLIAVGSSHRHGTNYNAA